MATAIKWLLLDLGNVCLEVNQGAVYERFASHFGVAASDLAWLVTKHRAIWDEIGTKEIVPRDAHTLFGPTLPKPLSESLLVECINSELGPQIEHTASVLEKLVGRVELGCLSNTNSIHVTKLMADYPVMNLFTRKFFSQELGLRKPDHAIYQATEQLLKVAPAEILFFDDRQENVDAASQCGWRAYLYTGPSSFLRGLGDVGIEA